VLSVCSPAQAKAGSLSDGFLSPERELFSLSEIGRVEGICRCFAWLVDGWSE